MAEVHWMWRHAEVWCDFDRASSLICGNKMTTRCNRWFLLQILLLAQHVSGTTMPIIRSSRVLYKWLLPVVFGALVFKLSVWCGAEDYVSGLRAASPRTGHITLRGIEQLRQDMIFHNYICVWRFFFQIIPVKFSR